MRELSSIMDEFSACYDKTEQLSKVNSSPSTTLDNGLVLELGSKDLLVTLFKQVKGKVEHLYSLADEALLGLDEEKASDDANAMLHSLMEADEILERKSETVNKPIWAGDVENHYQNIRNDLNIISQNHPI
ncbi:MAG: hypothetical protein COA45_10985 [Zetaproteobacteria bacterium]|nr:MAG: hypothetical protein COA45_10985 [Zetaproteobacteria bacterium]